MINELLQEVLVCPACGGELASEARGELLRCVSASPDSRSSCGRAYPVVDGIPRMFIGELSRVYVQDFPEVARKYPEIGRSADRTDASPETQALLETRASFGYEWTVYSAMLPEWEQNARFYFE